MNLNVVAAEDISAALMGADSIDNWNPGDEAEFTYTMSNTGNKAMRVQEVVTLTVTGVSEDDVADCMLFIEDTGYTPTEVGTIDGQDGYVLTYIVDEFVLSGKADMANTEVVDENADTKEVTYTLAFSKDAMNEYQGVGIDIDVEVAAVQYYNSSDIADGEVYTLFDSAETVN